MYINNSFCLTWDKKIKNCDITKRKTFILLFKIYLAEMIFSHLTKHLENFQSLQTLIEERKDLENNNKWTRLPIPAFVIFIIASHIFFLIYISTTWRWKICRSGVWTMLDTGHPLSKLSGKLDVQRFPVCACFTETDVLATLRHIVNSVFQCPGRDNLTVHGIWKPQN